jgi:hypothetical protein
LSKRNENFIGYSFGKLKVISFEGVKNEKRIWRCKCTCGSEVLIPTVRLNRTMSCGCLQKEITSKRVIKDITNQKFGRLTVIERSHITKKNGSYYKCLCDCGNELIIKSSYLISGDTKSCGCLKKDVLSQIKKNHLYAGQRFGRLEVISYAKRSRWLCKCDCGQETVVSSTSLLNGVVVSCGCYSKEQTSKRMMGKPISLETRKKLSVINKGKYISDATKQKMSFALKGKRIGINNPFYGKTHTKEARLRISTALIGKYRGENSPHWNYNISMEDRLCDRRYNQLFVDWRTSIFKRDDYTCYLCKIKGKYMQAHHIYPWNKYKHIRYELWNGITMCKDCHNKTKGKELEMSHLFIPHLRKYMD